MSPKTKGLLRSSCHLVAICTEEPHDMDSDACGNQGEGVLLRDVIRRTKVGSVTS